MKIIKIFLPVIHPIADILAILTFFGISATLLWSKITSISLFYKFLLVIAFLLLIHIIIDKFRQSYKVYEDYKIKNDLEKGILIKNVQDITKILPNTDTLKKLYLKTVKRSHEWAGDAVLVNFSLYLKYNGTWEIPVLQTYYYSKWKDEEASFYEGKHNSDDYNEPILQHLKDNYLKYKLIPFFELNSNWQNEIVKAFNKMSTKVDEKFEISIQQHIISEIDHRITIRYKEGKLNKQKKFMLDLHFKLKI